MTLFSLSLQYFTVLIPWPPRLPGGGAGEFGVLPVLLFGRPIQNVRHFLLESFMGHDGSSFGDSKVFRIYTFVMRMSQNLTKFSKKETKTPLVAL